MLGYVHHSGRYSRTAAALGSSLVDQAKRPGVNMIGVTEVANPKRKAGARNALAAIGWGLAADADSECAIAFDADEFALLDSREVVVSHVKTWTTKGKPRAPFKLMIAYFREKATGLKYVVAVAHTPSAVQSGHHWRHNNRARQHRDGMKGIHRALRDYGKRHHASGGRVLSMDLNLDLGLSVWRRYLARNFPALTLVRDRKFVGTLGSRRTIDAVLVSRNLNPLRWFKGKRIRVIRAKDSDHKSVFTRLAHVARKVRRKRK